MKRRSTTRVSALLPALAIAIAMGTAGCAEEVTTGGGSKAGDEVKTVKEGLLTWCTNLPYAPFESEVNGEIVGLDVDLVNKIADNLGVKPKMFEASFEAIESGQAFETGQCDIAAAAMTITDDRKKVLDFSDPYFDANQALLVKKDSGVTDFKDLSGKVLGVQKETTGLEYAEEHKAEFGYETKVFEDLGLLQQAVKSNQVDAGINDNGVHYDFVKKNPDCAVTTEFPTGEQYGIGMLKGNGALRAKVNESVKAWIADDFDASYEKWLGAKPDGKPGES